MPLTICPDCKREVSDTAPACPHCGRPMKATPVGAPAHGTGEGCFLRTMNIGCMLVAGFIVLVIALLVISGSIGSMH